MEEMGRRGACIGALAIAGALLCGALAAPSSPAQFQSQPIDTSLLETATPNTTAEMDAMTPSGIAVVARAWWVAGRPDRANPLLDYLEGLGTGAFGIRATWTPFAPVNRREYPANAIYSVVLSPVARAYFVTGREGGVRLAKRVIRDRIGFRRGCFAYDDQRPKLGCVHNANAAMLSLISWLDPRFRRRMRDEYAAALRYERRTILPDGSWWYWQHAPSRTPNDFGHQAGTAINLLTAEDPRLNRLGQRALGPIRSTWSPDPAVLSPFDQARAPGTLAALITGGDAWACALVSQIPRWEHEWALPDYRKDPIAAWYHVWTQARCAQMGVAT